MYRPSFAFWYCVFLFVISSQGKDEEYWKIFTDSDEKNDNSMPYEYNANSTKKQDNKTTLMHNNFLENFLKNESEANFMEDLSDIFNEDEDIFNEDEDILSNLLLHAILLNCNDTCVQHCCHLILYNCKIFVGFTIYDFINSTSVRDLVDNFCTENETPNFDIMDNDINFFNNIFSSSHHDRFLSLMFKCFSVTFLNFNVCNRVFDQPKKLLFNILIPIKITSLLCLLITFIVYSVCPELRNLHGYALRSYVATLSVTIFLHDNYMNLFTEILSKTYSLCVVEGTFCATI